jgi:hypothetical protein
MSCYEFTAKKGTASTLLEGHRPGLATGLERNGAILRLSSTDQATPSKVYTEACARSSRSQAESRAKSGYTVSVFMIPFYRGSLDEPLVPW